MKNIWLSDPEEKDFPAAFDYLELIYKPSKADKIVTKLRKAITVTKKAKDIYRASQLPLLDKENRHVKINLKKFENGDKLSPILLVRQENKLIIADGYHRLCASYYLSEDLDVPCRLV